MTLSHESLHVPLIVHDARDGAARGAVRDEPVDLLDVPTTLLALAGVAPAPGMRGRDLLASDTPLSERDLFAELHLDPLLESRIRPRSHQWSLQRWPWKVISHRRKPAEFIHKERDFLEQRPLGPEAPDVPTDLARDGFQLRQGLVASGYRSPVRALDPETREGLRALGYAE